MSLIASLNTAGHTLAAFQEALSNVQNNISNVNTPGYASQSVNLTAQQFDIVGGFAGGVAAQGLHSARDEYAEEEVRRQLSTLGMYETQTQGTDTISGNF